MKGLPAEALDVLVDLVYPPICPGCERPLEPGNGDRDGDLRGPEFCPACRRELRRITPPYCEVCGQPFDGAIETGFRCSNCAGQKFHFDFAVAGYRAQSVVRDLVHRFKYLREFHLCRPLATLLEDGLSDARLGMGSARDDWILVPVPLHPRRERERTFNQAAELCRLLGKRRGWQTLNILRRTRYTSIQARLDRSQRLDNIRESIALHDARSRAARALEGSRVLLVDDVLTTGATASECARVLRESGKADKVIVLTVARG